MKRMLILSSVVLVIGAAAILPAQAPVPVGKEPRHKTLLDTFVFRILEVTVPPGDTTLDHSHDRDIATVSLNESSRRGRVPGEDWSAPRERPRGSVEVTEYTGKPGTHRVETVSKTPYHLIAVENHKTGSWTTPKPLKAPGTTLNRETRAFSVYDVKLGPSTPQTAHVHDVTAVAVLVSGTIENGGSNGEEPAKFERAGQWIFIPTGPHEMNVFGPGEAHVVEIEVR